MTGADPARKILVVLGMAALAFAARTAPALADDAAPPAEPPTDHPGEPRVVLDMSACPPDTATAVLRILAIEIGDVLVEPRQPVSSNDDRLSYACDGNLIRITADGSRPAARFERTLSLSDFPADAAPRALALAGIEAIATLSPTVRRHIQARARPIAKAKALPSATSTVETPPPPVVVLYDAPSPPATPDSSSTITLSAIWRRFPTAQGISAWGGRVAVDRPIGMRFNLALDLDVVAGDRQLPAGEVAGVLISGGASFGLRGQWPHVAYNLAVGARGGVARLVGHPRDAASVAGSSAILPWAGPMLSGRILAGRGRLFAGATMEIGMAFLEAKGTANGDTVMAIRGVWVSLGLGAGIRL